MLVLLDGSHALHRMRYRRELSSLSYKGKITGLCHGFLRSLGYIVRENRGNCQIVCCWDKGGSKYRASIMPTYKDGRHQKQAIIRQDPKEQKLWESYLWTRKLLHSEILPNIGCLSIQIPGVEADDIIGWCCAHYPGNAMIVSTDADLYQLIDDKHQMFDPVDKKRITKESIISKFDLIPEHFQRHYVLGKSIFGDKDEAPGIRGLGKVWAYRLAKLYIEKGKEGFDSKNKKHKLLLDNWGIFQRNIKLIKISRALEDEYTKRSIEECIKSTRVRSPTQSMIDGVRQRLREYGLLAVFSDIENVREANSKFNSIQWRTE